MTNKKPQTLAETLYFMPSPELRDELETFRKQYEKRCGILTDLSKTYTSQLPNEKQEWLLDNYPEHYFKGLPPFVQEYLKRKMQFAAKEGRLDDEDSRLATLYMKGLMKTEEPGPSR